MATALGWAALVGCFALEIFLLIRIAKWRPKQCGDEMSFWAHTILGAIAILFFALKDFVLEVPPESLVGKVGVALLVAPMVPHQWRARSKSIDEIVAKGKQAKWTTGWSLADTVVVALGIMILYLMYR